MGAASARRLHQVRDAAVLHLLDALEREGRARTIPDEALAARVITGGEAHVSVSVEAVVGPREARLLAVQVLAGVLPGREGPAEEGASREREAREGVDGRVRGRLVAAVFRGTVVEVAGADPGHPRDLQRRVAR
jgi:hypothetical protein